MSVDALIVRRARREEAARIADAQRRAWMPELPPGSSARAGAWWNRMEAPAGLTLVAAVGQRWAGFACAMTPSRDEDADGIAEVAALHVEPAHRRSGVATALLDAMAVDLRDRGFATATLWVRADNVPARALYWRLGWRPDGARKVADDGGAELRLRRGSARSG